MNKPYARLIFLDSFARHYLANESRNINLAEYTIQYLWVYLLAFYGSEHCLPHPMVSAHYHSSLVNLLLSQSILPQYLSIPQNSPYATVYFHSDPKQITSRDLSLPSHSHLHRVRLINSQARNDQSDNTIVSKCRHICSCDSRLRRSQAKC